MASVARACTPLQRPLPAFASPTLSSTPLLSSHASRPNALRRALAYSAPMHPVVSLFAEYVVTYHQLFVPLLFSIFATIGQVHTPVQHSLLVTAISWAVVWVPTVLRAGIYSNSDGSRRYTSWLAGACIGLSQICDRAACDKEGTWVTKVGYNVMYCLSGPTHDLHRLSSRSSSSSSRRTGHCQATLNYPLMSRRTAP